MGFEIIFLFEGYFSMTVRSKAFLRDASDFACVRYHPYTPEVYSLACNESMAGKYPKQ